MESENVEETWIMITREKVEMFVELVSEIHIKKYNQKEYAEIVQMIFVQVFMSEEDKEHLLKGFADGDMEKEWRTLN